MRLRSLRRSRPTEPARPGPRDVARHEARLDQLVAAGLDRHPSEVFAGVPDDFWLWANTDGRDAHPELAALLPGMPEAQVQQRWTGKTGYETQEEGFRIHRVLERRAAAVRDVAIYETRRAAALPPELLDALEAGRLSWITFTSSSTARNLAALLGEGYRERLANVKLASIGPITTATLRELGLEPHVQAETFNVEGLVAAILCSSNPASTAAGQ